MALMTVQNITRTGLTPAYSAVAASDTFTPDAQTFLHVKNAGGGADSVTIPPVSANPIPGLTLSLAAISVPATTGDKMIGPFPKQFFADPVTGFATVNHGATASVTAAALNLNQP